ncbi:MAG: RsmE family RNA methyltransferase [Akkermansiaceae bacterium]
MDRFFLPSDQWGDNPSLMGVEAHHCFRVMRKQAGDHIMVFDGNGREAESKISEISSKTEIRLELLRVTESEAPLPRIEVAVGIPKGKSFDLILQKAVEMGVNRIQPLVTDQGNVRFKKGEGVLKRDKWQRSVLEACKQCGQNHLPEVMVPKLLGDYLEDIEPGGIRIVAALTPETKPLKVKLEDIGVPERLVAMVGPEGDFSEDEYERIFKVDFAPVRLGELVLRTETAVLWMAAAVRYQFQS